ncbi:hypothetical protein TRIUR3_33679 [Triticum urartu]|uniref:LOB domain-containing protein n=1 Tax=Triticum urartu TaxID=4572 RepID=M7YED1_TRIUA|nr:hypothetical protein TRIUR3_33679 [Triticum urartu]
MRLSCNGCRVLRKGCSEDCSIRPCLQWIKSPEAQANATVFLANHESSDSRHEDPGEPHYQQEASADTEAEAGSHVSQAEQEQEQSTEPAAEHAEEVEKEEDEELALELTLGFAPVAARPAGFHLSVRTAAEPAFVGLRFL